VVNNCRHIAFEIIIYNDNSSDNTNKVIKNYLLKTDNVDYVYISSPLRRYGKHDDAFVYNEIFNYARGDYIAFCDGDDVWCDGKIGNQYTYMQQMKDVSMTFGPSHVIDASGNPIGVRNKQRKLVNSIFSLKQMLLSAGGLFHTSNVMIKKDALLPIPTWFNSHYTGDYPLGVLAALRGRVIQLPTVWAKYRKLSTSVSHYHQSQGRAHQVRRARNIYRKNKNFIRLLENENLIKRFISDMQSKECYRFLSRLLDAKYYTASIARFLKMQRELKFLDAMKYVLKLMVAISKNIRYKLSM
jgi:glycosyltransferase involved in cell wall biosynthesis